MTAVAASAAAASGITGRVPASAVRAKVGAKDRALAVADVRGASGGVAAATAAVGGADASAAGSVAAAAVRFLFRSCTVEALLFVCLQSSSGHRPGYSRFF